MLPSIRTCLANPFWTPTRGNFPVLRARELPYSRVAWPERSISSAVQKQLLHLLWNSAKILSSASTTWEGLGPQLHQLQTQKKREKKMLAGISGGQLIQTLSQSTASFRGGCFHIQAQRELSHTKRAQLSQANLQRRQERPRLIKTCSPPCNRKK